MIKFWRQEAKHSFHSKTVWGAYNCIGVPLEEYGSQGFLSQKKHLTMTHFQGAAHGTMKLTLEKCIYDCPEPLSGWEMWLPIHHPKVTFLLFFSATYSEVPKGLSLCDSILLHSISLAKEAKGIIIAHTLGETKVNHIQVNFLKVKTFFFWYLHPIFYIWK